MIRMGPLNVMGLNAHGLLEQRSTIMLMKFRIISFCWALAMALCSHRCTSIEEVAIKVRYLASLGCDLESRQRDAFFWSILRGLTSPRRPRDAPPGCTAGRFSFWRHPRRSLGTWWGETGWASTALVRSRLGTSPMKAPRCRRQRDPTALPPH
jgi:hypothetical protein